MTQPPDPMAEAKAWLDEQHLHYTRKTEWQLKIGKRVSYFPTTGTTFVDGEKRARECTGLRALEEILIELRYLQPDENPTSGPTALRVYR